LTKASNAFDRQAAVRRYGASLGLIAAALLLSRFVTPSGASSPLVLLGATAAVAYFGGLLPALAATATAAIVNGVGIGLEDWPRLAVESTMIVLLGVILAFRAARSVDAAHTTDAVPGEALVTKSPTPDLEAPASELDSKAGSLASPEVKTLTIAREEMPKADEEPGPGVLVVHGNGVLRLALRSTLSGLGYSVRDAANLATAEPMLASQRFDAVVIDLGRVDEPNLSSIERVRKLLSAPDESIVALANIEHEDDRELLMAAGADLVLAKPIDTAGVAAKLRGLLPPPNSPAQSRVGLGASP
jgi:CheY-like chemotaxis protein